MMRSVASAVIAAALLAACAAQDEPPPPPAPPPPPIEIFPDPLDIPPPPPPDSCGAWELQSLLGQPRSAIPPPLYPERRRVTCTTCPVTRDYREDRLNIFFDADTGIIQVVNCG